MKKWFTTWNRPEYKEWAREIKGGYSLVIIRKESNNLLCVKAKLFVREKGLPDFKVIKEFNIPTQKKADALIRTWKH